MTLHNAGLIPTVMKPILYCNEELYSIKFCTNLGQ